MMFPTPTPQTLLAPQRADIALVSRGVVRSRALAQRLIDAGAVSVVVAGLPSPVNRRSQMIFADQQLAVSDSAEARFASRGGAKLEGALDRTTTDCRGLSVLDVGMSTGGFTDCLLQRGAARVVGIEVGHSQLDAGLAADPRVRCFEKTNIRDVTAAWLAAHDVDAAGFGLIVADLSFIATTSLLGHLAGLAAPGTRLLALIKPQFELGPDARNARGIVRAGADIDGLRERSREAARQAGWQPLDWFACALAGTDGNQEYFLHARRGSDERSPRTASPGSTSQDSTSPGAASPSATPPGSPSSGAPSFL